MPRDTKIVPFRRPRRQPPTLKQLMAGQRRNPRKLVALGAVAFALTVALGLAWPQLSRQLVAAPWARAGQGGSVRVTRVIDGDTFDIAGGERVRIRNIDTAETPPRSRCALEAHLALMAKARLQDLMRRGDEITLSGMGRDRDKYGRLLRWVRIDGQDVGDQLIREGLAQPWRGHKATWC
jgi:micrococcal nuclease